MSTRRVNRIDELKRDILPARDLWPAIAAAIEADKAAAEAPAGARRRPVWMPAAGMAAAVALVAIGVLIGRVVVPPVPPATPATAGTTTTVNPDVRQASFRDPEYQKQRDALMEEVQARLAAMPEAEREKVGASLATLRRSILEIEAALGCDPANALLQELFVSSCQEEMRALTAVRDSGSQEI